MFCGMAVVVVVVVVVPRRWLKKFSRTGCGDDGAGWVMRRRTGPRGAGGRAPAKGEL